MGDADLAFAGLARQAALVRAGEVSSRELVELYLERIARIEPQLNCYSVVLAERALIEADQADSRRAAGDERPLLGVPVAIKDNVDVAGTVTTFGTEAHGPPATQDAELVRRLRTAGCVVLGKTTLPELAIMGTTEGPAFGVTRNPWNADRTPGGSSGGSGAAVAAGLAAAGHASDGAGSIRIPAACCGLFGLKPQRGRVPLAPDDEDAWHGLTVAGAVTRTVLDNALFLDAIAGPGPAPGGPTLDRPFADAAREPPGKLRIAVSLRPPLLARLSPVVRQAIDETADLLRGLGHDVEYVEPPLTDWPTELLPRYLKGIERDAARMARPERLQRRTRSFARLGSLIPQAMLDRALRIEQQVSDRYNRVLADRDVLLTPTTAAPPPGAAEWEGVGALRTLVEMIMVYPYCVIWNGTGQPAAAVPAGFTADGLPLSAQLIAKPAQDHLLLSLAAQIEAERPWADKRPPVD
ncbi:MAG TPA: amidase [Thermoleophilaceae bacterium]|nr:amidase [Thermoleophilaceae bacterium]